MSSPTDVELLIGGMTCASCANRIEKKLNKMPGVRATVNYATERAVILGLPPEKATDAVGVVEAAGYGAAPVVEGEEGQGYADRVKMLRNRLIVATSDSTSTVSSREARSAGLMSTAAGR